MSGSSKPLALIGYTEEEDNSRGYPPSLVDLYRPYFNIKTVKQAQEERVIEQTQVVFMDPSHTAMFVGLVQQMPGLKVLATVSAGYNHMDKFPRHYLREKGIKMTYTKGVLDKAVADMAMALLLTSARNIVPGVRLAMGPTMPQFRYGDFGQEVSGSTLGIVGLGGIGLQVAQRAFHGFNMKIVYHNRRPRPSVIEETVKAEFYPTLEMMLPQCDFVVISCALTPETENLISFREFHFMKKTARIINVSRGDVIDQEALIEALISKRIRGAALDVTSPEPLPRDHALLKCPNCVIVPHYGSATLSTRKAMHQAVIDDALAALEGRPMDRELFV